MNRCLVVATLSACAPSIYAVPINPPPRALAARPPATVEVYSSARPERPFVDVAYLEAEVNNEDQLDRVIGELRAHAARLGCDGIVFNGRDSKASYSAVCIVYR